MTSNLSNEELPLYIIEQELDLFIDIVSMGIIFWKLHKNIAEVINEPTFCILLFHLTFSNIFCMKYNLEWIECHLWKFIKSILRSSFWKIGLYSFYESLLKIHIVMQFCKLCSKSYVSGSDMYYVRNVEQFTVLFYLFALEFGHFNFDLFEEILIQ